MTNKPSKPTEPTIAEIQAAKDLVNDNVICGKSPLIFRQAKWLAAELKKAQARLDAVNVLPRWNPDVFGMGGFGRTKDGDWIKLSELQAALKGDSDG